MSLFNKKNLDKNRNPYGITEKDIKGQIEGFPIGVVVRMMEECEKQGGKPNVKAFQNNICEGILHNGGFDWGKTQDGSLFWVIVSLNGFDDFFARYPEYKKYN